MEIFKNRVEEFINSLNQANLDTDLMRAFSQRIITYTEKINYLDAQEFNFSFLFKISKADSDQLIVFTDSIYMLVNKRVNFFQQKFHYFNTDCDSWELYRAEDFSYCLRHSIYLHPISSKEISKKEYFDLVQPFFIATNELLGVINNEF